MGEAEAGAGTEAVVGVDCSYVAGQTGVWAAVAADGGWGWGHCPTHSTSVMELLAAAAALRALPGVPVLILTDYEPLFRHGPGCGGTALRRWSQVVCGHAAGRPVRYADGRGSPLHRRANRAARWARHTLATARPGPAVGEGDGWAFTHAWQAGEGQPWVWSAERVKADGVSVDAFAGVSDTEAAARTALSVVWNELVHGGRRGRGGNRRGRKAE